jgi:hypothetical protein
MDRARVLTMWYFNQRRKEKQRQQERLHWVHPVNQRRDEVVVWSNCHRVDVACRYVWKLRLHFIFYYLMRHEPYGCHTADIAVCVTALSKHPYQQNEYHRQLLRSAACRAQRKSQTKSTVRVCKWQKLGALNNFSSRNTWLPSYHLINYPSDNIILGQCRSIHNKP